MSLALRLTGARRRAQIVATRRNDAICGTVDPAETEARLSVVLDAAVRHLGDRHPVTLNTRCVLGAVRHLGPRWREAEGTIGEAIAGFDPAVPVERFWRWHARTTLVSVRAWSGDAAKAVEELRALADDAKQAWGPTPHCDIKLGLALVEAHEFAEAVELLRKATVELDEAVCDEAFAEIAREAARLGEVPGRSGVAATHRLRMAARLGVAVALSNQDDGQDAADAEFRALLAEPGIPIPGALECRRGLARLAARRGERDGAAEELERIACRWRAVGGGDHPRTRAVEAELAALRR
ncbi:hypothetical protein [Amycolatopsis sp. CA-230715]|uniref:hypothetical protein n=1 Tax=Amycolatopsis sp. CA-230715 TaxID=2745196 RepID=UPI001C00D7C8|nr:hypothetical protein [Amycolatopsis sp. CA-230715]QWF76742.1 hypothetical protein HUW46_00118 [Amycolatopsis sp. CA-230715]